MMQIESLQFGGGAHYAAIFLGALHQLLVLEVIDLKKISTFGGSSAGSVIALLLNVGFTPKEVFEESVSIDLEDIFLNDVNIGNLFANNGFCYGKSFVEKVVEIVQKKIPNFDMKTTFESLLNMTGFTLVVSGTNLTQKKVVLFSHKSSPKMSVMYAIRLSVSIPLLFRTLEYKNDLYVDGAWFKDIRESESSGDYFKKETSLHFVIKAIPCSRGSFLDIAGLLRGFFIDYVLNFDDFSYIIEFVINSHSLYDREGLLFLYHKGIVVTNAWLHTLDETNKSLQSKQMGVEVFKPKTQ